MERTIGDAGHVQVGRRPRDEAEPDASHQGDGVDGVRDLGHDLRGEAGREVHSSFTTSMKLGRRPVGNRTSGWASSSAMAIAVRAASGCSAGTATKSGSVRNLADDAGDRLRSGG